MANLIPSLVPKPFLLATFTSKRQGKIAGVENMPCD